MKAAPAASTQTKIFTDIDYERNGKQVGWLGLNHSVTRSAYGAIMIPIAVIKNGSGPTAFFMAGNHGDEYEGQVALVKLIRALRAEEVQGRVIILPAANLPAAMAGTRVSPIDDGNLNRSFPGSADGTVTQQIAHYINTVLFPLADTFHDLHSGGGSLDYVPFASVHHGWDDAINARGLATLRAFGAPISVVWKVHQDVRFAPVAAMTHGLPSLGGEFGGGGRVNKDVVAMVERGLRNTLFHMNIIEKPRDWAPPRPTRLMEVPNRDSFVYAPEPGLFEPAVNLGDTVAKGDLCGHVHFVDNPGREPEPCYFRSAGFVICKRHFGRVERGDCVAHLANDVAA